MKAIIFSCSLKNGKYSTTMAWSKLMMQKFNDAGVQSHIVNLKDYDYEATTSGDDLHMQMAHAYDADYILFAAPINMGQTTFSCKNLIDRFVHANANAQKLGIDIFKDKIYEYVTFGAHIEGFNDNGDPIVRTYNRQYGEWNDHHGYLRNRLGFIDNLGMDDLAMGTFHPDDPSAPTFDQIKNSKEAKEICDRIVKGFKKNKNTTAKLPACSKERFLEMFKSHDANAFGRGMTLSKDNLNQNTVEQHIDFVNKNVVNTGHKIISFICMKERCIKMERYDLARLYYVQQFQIIKRSRHWKNTDGKNIQNKGHCTGNYAPIGY
jgi:multimeric flavodoxin WrbA